MWELLVLKFGQFSGNNHKLKSIRINDHLSRHWKKCVRPSAGYMGSSGVSNIGWKLNLHHSRRGFCTVPPRRKDAQRIHCPDHKIFSRFYTLTRKYPRVLAHHLSLERRYLRFSTPLSKYKLFMSFSPFFMIHKIAFYVCLKNRILKVIERDIKKKNRF